jgi:hypothetical protein
MVLPAHLVETRAVIHDEILTGLTLGQADHQVLREIASGLHGDGWATHVPVLSELQLWKHLAAEVNHYRLSVDDYTNDLCSRDAVSVPNES